MPAVSRARLPDHHPVSERPVRLIRRRMGVGGWGTGTGMRASRIAGRGGVRARRSGRTAYASRVARCTPGGPARTRPVCGLALSRTRLRRFPHVRFDYSGTDVLTEADAVGWICPRCLAATAGRRGDGEARLGPGALLALDRLGISGSRAVLARGRDTATFRKPSGSRPPRAPGAPPRGWVVELLLGGYGTGHADRGGGGQRERRNGPVASVTSRVGAETGRGGPSAARPVRRRTVRAGGVALLRHR